MKKSIMLSVILLSFMPIFSQNVKEGWWSNLFVQGNYTPYFLPGELGDYAKSEGGFRAAAGYDLQFKKQIDFPFCLESGYSRIVGTNPLILDIKSIPVSAFGGINWSPVEFFSLYASIGAGTLISTVEHYNTALDVAKNNLSVDTGFDFLLGARLGLSLNLLNKSLCFYCDGGLDLILENDGPIPLPLLNAGLRIYPGRVYSVSKILVRTVTVEKIVETTVETTVERAEYFSDRVILFGPESVELSDEAKKSLGKVGEHMSKYPDVKLELTGYAAPYGNKKDQLDIAEKRSNVVKKFICENYGIDSGRILVRKSKTASEDSRDSNDEVIQLRSVVCHIYE